MGNKTINFIFKGVIVVIVLLFLLLSAYLLFNKWHCVLNLDTNFNPSDYFSILISSGVTLIAALYITKALASNRFDKEFIIDDLRKIVETLNKIESCFVDSQDDCFENAFRYLNIIHGDYERMAIYLDSVDIKVDHKEFKEKLFYLYEATAGMKEESAVDTSKISGLCGDLITSSRTIIGLVNNK